MNEPSIFAFAQPEENKGYLLWQVSMKWQLQMNQKLRPLGLTLTQFSLMAGLYWLRREGESVTQQRLADFNHMDKMMTSKILQALEVRGLVERADSAQDKRLKLLRLTEAGQALLREANQRVEQVDAGFFKPIQPEGGRFNELMRQLLGGTPKG